ncbi:Amyloid beta A4 precursor protein-binding family B member 1 [Stylophora pistillata]|uniref:Amyloid beta A4 protein-binding family B member 1 n=1 Tax=Stylophora pistillata TaxID=50429 RepID=A0A2B4RJ83_STYPI|nr:Amyloid beta A4 precursor protein-binding family B member 1 [Stylophora pistillata]
MDRLNGYYGLLLLNEDVTKVRGLSDLSEKAKVSEKTEPSSKRSRGSANSSERPSSSHGRQTALKKTASPSKSTPSEAAGSKSTGKTALSHRTNPPKPATRTKQTAHNSSTTVNKSCAASQQDKQSPGSITDTSATKKRSTSQGVNPLPRTKTTAITKPLSQKPVKEPNNKKKSEIKKENSYDASDSDSENGSIDRLNTDGDFGYETGSLDDSDVSTGELLSPSARDENKTILTTDQSRKTGYLYAEVEFGQVLASKEGDVAAKNSEKFDSGGGELVVVDSSAISDHKSYTYAGDEFRPLIVTEQGGISAPVEAKKSSKSSRDENSNGDRQSAGGRKKMVMEYEEVEVIDGGYDRTNIKVTSANQRNTAETDNSHTLGPLNDVYAVVQKKPKETDCNDSGGQKQNSSTQRPTLELGDVAPSIPGGRKDSSMYEAITGELQNMIMACDEVSLDQMSSRTSVDERKSSSGDRKVPPPIPKPYSGPGLNSQASKEPVMKELSENSDREPAEVPSQPVYAVVQKKQNEKLNDKSSEEISDTTPADMKAPGNQPTYAVVQKIPKPELNGSVESLDQLRIPGASGDDDDDSSDEEMPPPLPSRLPNLEHTMKRTDPSQNTCQFDKVPKLEEKSKEGGFKLFKKKHCRQLSDGNVTAQLKQDTGNSDSLACQTEKNQFHHRRSKSHADIVTLEETGDGSLSPRNTIENYSEIIIPSNKTKNSSDKVTPVQPYLEVDITEPPSTPTDFNKEVTSMGGDSEDQNVSYELPEGWKEVNGDNGTYYWHVASGTTQWTMPQVATRPKKKSTEEAKPAESTERQKVLSFPVHSMGWIELEESQVAPHNMSETISDCISTLAQKRKDLWHTGETWGEELLKLGIIKRKYNVMFTFYNASFNEKPHVEAKKSFSARYVGSIDVPKPTGVEVLNKAISKVTNKAGSASGWKTILIEISVSNIRITDCTTQELISEDRVRFMSFFGVGKDERLCGYIVSTAPDVFVCHVFQCSPNAAPLTKALAEACELRFQKCVDAHPNIIQKKAAAEQEKVREKSDKEKDKAGFMTSVQGLLGKLGTKKGGGKKEESSTTDSKQSSVPVITCKPTHTFMVKYYGALPVAVGTGIETVEEAAKHLAGGTLLICQLDVALNGVTLYDSQRSSLSKRNLDADTISYCGLTSNRSHFGLIQSMGGGKYICHVFAEYKTKAGPIVAAIHETL